MTTNLGSDIDKVNQSLQRAWQEAKGIWKDRKADQFESQSIASLTVDAEHLRESLDQLQDLIQSSEKSFPLE